MPTITDAMVDAANRVLIRYVVADQQDLKLEDVTEEAITAELAEIDEGYAEQPELPTMQHIIGEMLGAALDVSGGAVTREPSDIWQAVLTTWAGAVWDLEDFEYALAPSSKIWIVRRSAAPVARFITKGFDPDDVALEREGRNGNGDLPEQYRRAQAMAAGLNAAEAS